MKFAQKYILVDEDTYNRSLTNTERKTVSSSRTSQFAKPSSVPPIETRKNMEKIDDNPFMSDADKVLAHAQLHFKYINDLANYRDASNTVTNKRKPTRLPVADKVKRSKTSPYDATSLPLKSQPDTSDEEEETDLPLMKYIEPTGRVESDLLVLQSAYRRQAESFVKKMDANGFVVDRESGSIQK